MHWPQRATGRRSSRCRGQAGGAPSPQQGWGPRSAPLELAAEASEAERPLSGDGWQATPIRTPGSANFSALVTKFKSPQITPAEVARSVQQLMGVVARNDRRYAARATSRIIAGDVQRVDPIE